MDKLKLHTPDQTAKNIEKLAELFPNCVTEAHDENGRLIRAVDFDQLRQELSTSVVEGYRERYRLDWPGKREAILAANAPIAKTLRPFPGESIQFETTKNLFIEGDNLDALKLIQETYLNKVKMIYIDPPYNTGKEFIYKDDFTESSADYLSRSNQKSESGDRMVMNPESNGRFHSDWLTMMYPRLKLARNLLTDDGVIFISIDDHELSSVKTICEEIFGSDNFVATIVWQKRYSRENRGSIGDAHEYVLTYTRSAPEFAINSGTIPLTAAQAKVYRNPDDEGGRWRGIPMTAQGFRPNQMYPITAPGGAVHTPPEGRCWSMIESEFRKLLAAGRIYFGKDNNSQPQVIRYLSEVEGLTPWTWLPHEEGGHTDEAKKEIYSLMGKGFGFDTPKPTRLITRLLQIASRTKDFLVMDFFAGSGTTAEAVMALNAQDGGNRRFILAQIPEAPIKQADGAESEYANIAEISKERIRRAGTKIKSETAVSTPELDVGFRVLKVDTSCMKDVYYAPDDVKQADLLGHLDNIRGDRTPEDLLFQVLVDWGVDLALPVTTEMIQGKMVFFVDQTALAACFETNISEELVKTVARRLPLRAVFRDRSYGSDSVKINVEQIFKLLSPSTEVKSL